MKNLTKKSYAYLVLFLYFTFSLLTILFLSFFIPSNHILAITLFTIGLFTFIYEYIRNNFDLFNPDGVFLGIWISTIGLSQLRLSNYQNIWNFDMWYLILSSLLAYVIGSKLTGAVLSSNFIPYKTSRQRILFIRHIISFQNLKFFLITSYFISFFAYLLEFIIEGYIPIFGSNIGDYANFGIAYVHYFVISIGIILVITYLYIVVYSNDGFLKVLFLIGVLILISILNRHVIIFTTIGIILVHNYFYKKINLRNAAFLIAIVLLGFTILGSLRNVSSEYLVLALGYEDEFNLVFMWVYYYLTIGFTNLQSIIISSPPLSFGLQTFTPLLTLSGLKGFFLESTNPYFTGVGTFLETYYLDFGTLGTFFFPLILGIVSKLVYFKITRASIGIIIFTIYFTIINQLVFVFFTDYFSYTHIPLQVIVSLILYFLSKQNHFYSKKLKKVI